ncbi:hypothetical protein AMECASPLE_017033 [Ameca splendens]|uniref:Uncharacterized protein n=1 Tax=Ameca splendens TaxID=208324 RepID=A0ABV0ZB55_9TELE
MYGSSYCQSEQMPLEHLLQSVALVLYIDRSRLWDRACLGQLPPFPLQFSPKHIICHLSLQCTFAFLVFMCSGLFLCNYGPQWLCRAPVTQSHLSLPANIMNKSFPLESPMVGSLAGPGCMQIVY